MFLSSEGKCFSSEEFVHPVPLSLKIHPTVVTPYIRLLTAFADNICGEHIPCEHHTILCQHSYVGKHFHIHECKNNNEKVPNGRGVWVVQSISNLFK